MTIRSTIIKFLFFLSVGLTLFSCGGGGNQLAEGGISGTGITMGRITNFGSIFVNGIEFDTSNATFQRDNLAAPGGQSDYRVGEFVIINGSVDAGGSTGTAFDVTFKDLLEGAVTQVGSPQGTSIRVLGQLVDTDLLTVFHGFTQLVDLQVGNIVEVSGVKDSAGTITATSITLKHAGFIPGQTENELKGIISNLGNQTFTIGNLTIDYSQATLNGFPAQGLQSGQFVEVKSTTAINVNTLVADSIKLENEYLDLQGVTIAEIEGQVTSFQSLTQFTVNGIPVTTTSQTQFKNAPASTLAADVFVEVEGVVDAAGVLVANQVAFEFENSPDGIEIEGNIVSINVPGNELVVNDAGQANTVVLDSSTLMVDESSLSVSPLTISDLRSGDIVDIEGITQADGRVLASRLERKSVSGP